MIAYLNATLNNNDISIHNFSEEDIQKLDLFAKAFETTIFEDLEKVLFQVHQILINE